jgi:hypothetical protein
MRKFLWPLLLLLGACAVPPREEVPPAAPPQPAPPPVAEELGPAETWKIVASQFAVRVYRDGPMQKLGHNHLITSSQLVGEIALREPLTQSRFDLSLPVESLVVDDDSARAAAGGEFAAPVPQKDRDATRQNMIGEKVLDAARQGEIRLAAESISGEAGSYEARVRVSLAGHEQVVTAPFTVTEEGGALRARAAFKLTHADLGLQPFTVALGVLKVRDDFDVELTLEARRGS